MSYFMIDMAQLCGSMAVQPPRIIAVRQCLAGMTKASTGC